MLRFNRSAKICAAVLAAAITLTSVSSQVYAATGNVRFHIVKAEFIVGIGGGSGVLNFKGRNYRPQHRRHQRRHDWRVSG